MMSSPSRKILDHQRDPLFGFAGTAIELQRPGTFPEVTGYHGGGLHGLDPGQWSDYSSMALALADSIASVRCGS